MATVEDSIMVSATFLDDDGTDRRTISYIIGENAKRGEQVGSIGISLTPFPLGKRVSIIYVNLVDDRVMVGDYLFTPNHASILADLIRTAVEATRIRAENPVAELSGPQQEYYGRPSEQILADTVQAIGPREGLREPEPFAEPVRVGPEYILPVKPSAAPVLLQAGEYGRLSERLAKHVISRVFEEIGSASMCWENVEKAGVFDSGHASGIAGRLCHFIADQLDFLRDANEMQTKRFNEQTDQKTGLMDRISELERELDQARGTWRERPSLI